jgi:hypothetical protein
MNNKFFEFKSFLNDFLLTALTNATELVYSDATNSNYLLNIVIVNSLFYVKGVNNV